MIVAEPYQRDGRTLLRNIRHADSVPPGYVDTGLASLPGPELGKLEWDGQRAAPPTLTAEEKLDRLDLPPRVLRALVIRAAPSATPDQRAAAGLVLDAALARIEEARSAAQANR